MEKESSTAPIRLEKRTGGRAVRLPDLGWVRPPLDSPPSSSSSSLCCCCFQNGSTVLLPSLSPLLPGSMPPSLSPLSFLGLVVALVTCTAPPPPPPPPLVPLCHIFQLWKKNRDLILLRIIPGEQANKCDPSIEAFHYFHAPFLRPRPVVAASET